MTISTIIDFLSRDCKNNIHRKCYGNWQGLGFQIICECQCHEKNRIMLDAGVPSTPSNIIQNKVIIDEDIQ